MKDRAADGLRGIAAMNVVLCHFLISLFPLAFANIYPRSAAPDATPHALDALISAPVVSLFWNGNFAVCVFFVLSGYVLTKVFVETGDVRSMQLRAARRYVRLCVPVFGSVLLSYVALSAGLKFSGDAAAVTGSTWLAHFWQFDPTWGQAWREGTYGALLYGKSAYTPILWTMRVEFIGSMIVFGFRALAPSGRAGWLSAATLAGALVIFFPNEWMLYLGFIAGSYLGQVSKPDRRTTVWLALGIAIICGGFDYSRWYAWTSVVPLTGYRLKHFVHTIGAIALLYAVRAGALHRVLTSRPAQFLGRISYAVYLVHFPILLTLSSWLVLALGAGREGMYTVVAAVDLVLTLAAVVLVATAFEATFDRFGIRLSRWLVPSSSAAGRDTKARLARPLDTADFQGDPGL